jgi:putative restriction endonuclease
LSVANDIFVGVTDRGWYEHLRSLSTLEEVNFWRPNPAPFRALEPGGFFLFKLHYPENAVVGGGIFARYSVVPLSLAWEAFEAKNGVTDLDSMIQRLSKYQPEIRSMTPGTRHTRPIGCILIQQPFFFAERDWFRISGWRQNIVSGKGYSSATSEGMELMRQVQSRMTQPIGALEVEGPRYGEPILVQPRLGQGSFRLMVTEAYRFRCPVTGDRVLPALEAAHIRPYAQGGRHAVSNGLLLRSDLHRLFDRGYLSVTPDLKVEISPRIREEFNNGREYYAFDGADLQPPERSVDHPDADALAWHRRYWGFAA